MSEYLSSFLRLNLAEQIASKAAKADLKEGLGGGTLPAHDVGACRKGWKLVGPPQLRRYMRYRPPRRADDGDEGGDGRVRGVGVLLNEVRRLFHSAAFVQLLSAMSGQQPR